VAIVLVVLIGGYYGVRALTGGSNGALKASGTIEATTVNVSPELAGKVQQVLVEEGQSVKTGQSLFRLDDTLLKAQRDASAAGLQAAQTAALTTQAAYASAQAQYTITTNAARTQARPTRLADWAGKTPDYFNQPKWYFTQAEQIAAAQVELGAAQANVTAMENNLAQVVSDLSNASFVEAEKRLSNARLSYLVALQVQQEGQSVGQGKAPNELDLEALNVVIPPQAPGYRVRIHLSQNLPNQELLYYASQTAYDAASSELSGAQVAYNQLLTSASAEKVLKARAAALSMGDLSQLTITVYVPEDRYGQIHLGQAASVNVDSFPGNQFEATVKFISDQAEFTPRNVQTVEGRSSTVYAIKLTVTDPQGKLKPGMPADVAFH
jgi:HlyD family secretion protein